MSNHSMRGHRRSIPRSSSEKPGAGETPRAPDFSLKQNSLEVCLSCICVKEVNMRVLDIESDLTTDMRL